MTMTLSTLLQLEPGLEDRWIGHSPQTAWKRIFGGLVVAQALRAAQFTSPGRPVHSLHAYFILPGDPNTPVEYAVDRIRDGRSFTTRRCSAFQTGRRIFEMLASFHMPEGGFSHFTPMPSIPDPDELPALPELVRRHEEMIPASMRDYLLRERPVELRPVSLARFVPALRDGASEASLAIWMRADSSIRSADQELQRASLAYMSDLSLLDATLVNHRCSVFETKIRGASLDHAMWFHQPFEASDWLLYVQRSPFAGGGRGFAEGCFYAREGRLVAVVAQEGLIRRAR
jgi:acyl-CoA thioesterase-2